MTPRRPLPEALLCAQLCIRGAEGGRLPRINSSASSALSLARLLKRRRFPCIPTRPYPASSAQMSAPITCHVLNTVSGTPASGLEALLTLLAPPAGKGGEASGERPWVRFHAVTNEDGRVKEWEPMC